ncbi:hypothetical protein BH747_10200 [Enterococcus villorum]|uniref:Uncharacterized protein n=1 Tax=Enterococcus villorum TaxID=112904 RepID=A0A1V8YM91_9ENTE|nr:sugar-binding domain-containing protein [Enterococcus villorum]OQO69270.1 hypothetical protein BH747_10200 [Enterococcus villorum]OQO73745.1 hypothetical protein BH744_08970 [Enterococcus villorum]
MSTSRKNDQYANIAMISSDKNKENLVVPTPPKIEKKHLPLGNSTETITLPPKIDNQDLLMAKVKKLRTHFQTFLEKKSPRLSSNRTKIILKTFDWRIETIEDQQNFQGVLSGAGDWDNVQIPHYGEPLGKATTYYRTKFTAPKIADNQALFIHFNGVDYVANVYINGYFVGNHEGFFAPFEFDISPYIHEGENTLLVQVKNDFVHKRNELVIGGEMFGGDKIYAATGPGYDDPDLGWHHCPPGMGIYQSAYLEIRARTFIDDIFVRPLVDTHSAEVNVLVYNCDVSYEEVAFNLSVYGENFEKVVFENFFFYPTTATEIGLGDTFNQAMLEATGERDKPQKLYAEQGKNFFKIPITLNDPLLWDIETPYLYEVQIQLINKEGKVLDTLAQTFGMRKFEMDEETTPKGKLYLNNKEIRLRGANTMGFEQRAVMNQDFDQLIEDILISKACHMNFWRITQRPVQEEVYQYCDHLGLMTQCDLPLFGVLRKNKFAEAVKQAEEMEQLVRKHPCNILCTYINEPFPNAQNLPQRHLTRSELNRFFEAADHIIKLNNPDRVIKAVDGDYDPPSKALPDNHCYTAWYNGHGLAMGHLAEGFWFPIKKDWAYGCGEFGCEALDNIKTMYHHYPKSWLPNHPDESWHPSLIKASQSPNFHYQFFETPKTLSQWVEASQEYQRFATKWMTEAFRRKTDMVSFALHILIDHYPAGWMKAVMDVDRQAKPAFFAYLDALTPTMVSIKPSRLTFTEGETASEEVWICNDLPQTFQDCQLHYQILHNGKSIQQGKDSVTIAASQANYVGNITFDTTGLTGTVTLLCVLLDK